MASLLLLTLGGEKGGGDSGGSTDGQLSCPEGSDYVGSSSLIGTSAALLGAVACVDTAAIAYRETLDASIAGTDTSTVNLYGPFEAGFTNTVPGLSCLGLQRPVAMAICESLLVPVHQGRQASSFPALQHI